MDDWIGILLACRRASEAAILITVASAKGSVPRTPGTRMVVTATHQHGTIGGGHLEMQAVGIARDLLSCGSIGDLRRFPLGASLGQCCGGMVSLMFEAVAPSSMQAPWLDEIARHRARDEACVLVSGAGRAADAGSLVVTAGGCGGSLGDPSTDAAAVQIARDLLACGGSARLTALAPAGPLFLVVPLREPVMQIVLFGAGHVGQALAGILGGLPCRVTWIDEREEQFAARVAANVRVVVSDAPVAEVRAARPDSCFLVMTHSHALDQALAEAILTRRDFRYFGLIGSLSKRRQFERRLAARGIGTGQLARMTCPIGIDGIDGKEPAAIAVAVAAQLLRIASQGVARAAGDAALQAPGLR